MPLYGSDIHEEDMYPSILRMLSRYYKKGRLLKKPYICRPHAYHDSIPDVVCYKAYNAIHVIEAKRYRRYVFDAVEQLKKYPGNFKYVALPDGEYFKSPGFVDDMIAGRFGLVLIHGGVNHMYAEFDSNSPAYVGDFSRYYSDYV